MNPPAATSPRFPLWERAAFAACAVVVAVAIWSALCAAPRYDWNGARLMPAFALAAGEKIYFPPDAGPALGWIYGPVMPVLLMPVAAMPTLTSAMIAAAAINAASLLAPLLLGVNAVAARAGLGRRERVWLLLATAGGALATPWIANALVFLAADNVVVGLALWSCLCLAEARGRTAPMWFAALLAALAVWTKQLAIGVPIAQLLWLAWSADRRAALRHAGRLLAAGAALAAVGVAIFGFDELRFNLWTVPSHHPLKGGFGFWLAQLGALTVAGLPWVLAIVLLRVRGGTSGVAPLVATVALVMWPLGALGASKVGGGENSFHAIYYVAAAAWLELAASGGALAQRIRQRAAPLAAVTALAGWLVVIGQVGWRTEPAPQLEASCTLAAAHRGEILFPRNPLVTWWTERKIYHLEYGYFDQALAGHAPTAERLAAWLPERLRYVVYQDDGVDHPFARLLPGFEREVRTPGFVIHVADAPRANQ